MPEVALYPEREFRRSMSDFKPGEIILIFIPWHLFENIIVRMASSVVIVETILLSSVMLIGLENNERAFIYNKVKEITKKIKK